MIGSFVVDKDGYLQLTNRPLSQEKSLWPKDDRLSIVSGIDLLAAKSTDELEQTMKTQMPQIGQVTHLIYLGKKDLLHQGSLMGIY